MLQINHESIHSTVNSFIEIYICFSDRFINLLNLFHYSALSVEEILLFALNLRYIFPLS